MSCQVPMSRFEKNEHLNDRYLKLEDRLKVAKRIHLLRIGQTHFSVSSFARH